MYDDRVCWLASPSHWRLGPPRDEPDVKLDIRTSQKRSPTPMLKPWLIVAWPHCGGTTIMSPGPCTHVTGRPSGIFGLIVVRHSVLASPVIPAYRGGVSTQCLVPKKRTL